MRCVLLPLLLILSHAVLSAPGVWRSGNILVIHDTEDTFGIESMPIDPDTNGFQDQWSKNIWLFLRTLSWVPDDYDFVAIILDQDSGFPDSRNAHGIIYSRVDGIGMQNKFLTGSQYADKRVEYHTTRLLGISGYTISQVSSPTAAAINMLHETGHQWCCHINFRLSPSTDTQHLLQNDGSDRHPGHWAAGVNLKTSPMGGSDWREDEEVPGLYHWFPRDSSKYHSLEHYLMGLIPPEEVTSFQVLQNYGSPPVMAGVGRRPAITQTVSIDNILLEEHDRNPDYRDSQRIFHELFVIVTKNPAHDNPFIAFAENSRVTYEAMFRRATDGKALIDTRWNEPGYQSRLYIEGGGDFRRSPDVWLVRDPHGTWHVKARVHAPVNGYRNVTVRAYLADRHELTESGEILYPDDWHPDRLIGEDVLDIHGRDSSHAGMAIADIEWSPEHIPYPAASDLHHSLLVEIMPVNPVPAARHHAWQSNKLAQKDLTAGDLAIAFPTIDPGIADPAHPPDSHAAHSLERFRKWIRDLINRWRL